MTLNPTRWRALSDLLDEALALPEAQRQAWLDALRARDAALATELVAMLPPLTDEATPSATTQPLVASFSRDLQAALGASNAVPPEHAAAPGLRLGPWELLRKIGEGGMGQVWLARRADGLYAAQAAIKLLRGDLNALGLEGRFARERSVLARLNHPAVARLLDAGIEHGQAYLVLEYVEGRLLVEHVNSHCPTVADRVRLMLRIAEAVDHAHAQLIVHRDLKPSNVMVTAEGVPKLLDFGIAGLLDDDPGGAVSSELTRQTGRGLTLGYAAPEQILGAPIGVAADVFSLGVMLYELLSGRLPYTARNASRLAFEHAVLHEDPRRLSTLVGNGAPPPDPGDPAQRPGRPVDAARVRGDLDAIVMRTLRREPAARYGSVRLLMSDLQAWLDHRPVAARRDDWRHRWRLWLRRNALLAGGAATVLATLGAGLTVSTWQWRRAEAAARQSVQVTDYLREMLASASPERHGGSWPTVLQLLESSRAALPQRFSDDPDTRLRLLEVMGDTYHELNRFDAAIPLREEQVALSRQRLGDDDVRTLEARFQLGRSQQVQGLFDEALANLEPLRRPFIKAFGVNSDRHRELLYVINGCYTRLGRLDDADRTLEVAGRLTEAMYPPGSEQRLSHINHMMVLRVGQGRMREAREVLRQTEAWWADPALAKLPSTLVLRRNTIAAQVRISEYDGLQQRGTALVAEMDRLLGPGNDMAAGLLLEMARALSETGQLRGARELQQQVLDRALAAKVQNPVVLLPQRVRLLLAQARAHAAAPAALKAETRERLAEVRQRWASLGYPRADTALNLARVALVLDDAALADDALAPLRADDSAQLRGDKLLVARIAQVEGQLARLRGDLPRSAELLLRRTQMYGPAGDPLQYGEWAAGLDRAWTLVLLRDPGAAAALQAASLRRPPGVPAEQALDAVQAYLAACLGPQGAGGAAAQAALAQLWQRQGRRTGAPAGPGMGSFGGALI